jgi:dolichol-phosphate mannosyltransferase
MQISVVVPCYNEEAVIDESHSVLYETMKSNFDDFEIIYINDGSKDLTRDLLNKISTSFREVRTIHFSRNFGHQPAVTAGIKFAKGHYIIIIDADLQDPPSLIPEMVAMARSENANVVYGVRKSRDGETWFKKQTAKIYYRLMNNLSETKFPLDTGDFRLIDRKIADEKRVI